MVDKSNPTPMEDTLMAALRDILADWGGFGRVSREHEQAGFDALAALRQPATVEGVRCAYHIGKTMAMSKHVGMTVAIAYPGDQCDVPECIPPIASTEGSK